MDETRSASERYEEIIRNHTDFIAETQPFWCYEFEIETLERESDGDYGYPPMKALLRALGEVKSHRNKRVRERAFTVWVGDYGPHFCIAVPEKLAAPVVLLIRRHLKAIPGYCGEESGYGLPLVPTFRYEYGDLIWYVDLDSAGEDLIDDEENGRFGSGFVLKRRTSLPAWFGGERYRRGTTNSGPGWKPSPEGEPAGGNTSP
ncbi:MAG: hypothetical protein QME79_12135 [Bacillota bacterium]|nr:hypothetical protein [Bacillota bacterium]